MADFSSYTHKWRATNLNTNNHTDLNKVVKRNRQPTSCQPCRLRKLKCGKGHPCESCSKRDEANGCLYGKSVSSSTPSSTTNPTTRHGRDEYRNSVKARDRLRQLEDLVRQIAAPGTGEGHHESLLHDHHGNGFATREADATAEGPLNRDRHGLSYTGSTHWSAVLDQIQDLRASLSATDSLSASSSPPDVATEDSSIVDSTIHEAASRASTLFGAEHPTSLQAVIQSYLPPRKQVDRHLSTYFNAKYLIVPCVHTGQFEKQYEAFWRDQSSTSPMWVSILFSIICIADNIRKAPTQNNPTNPQEPLVAKDHFLAGAAQCLVLGNYTKPQPHLIEALAFYIQCRFVMSLDPSRELGLVFSILARQAFTMGYHRDPSKFPGQFTPFEGEQRRRCWAALRQFDLMIAFQLGIPQTIPPDSSDTQFPRNILDADFDEHTAELPPSRPETELTTMLYFVVKSRLMAVYSKVVQHSLSFHPQSQSPSRSQIMALHAEIDRGCKSIPPVLFARPMSSSYSDPSYFIMLRTNLFFLVQKAYMVLHRRHMTRKTPDAAESRDACLQAGTKIASHFIDLHGETGPGGQLHADHWMINSFTINDFLLAAMLICLIVWQDWKDVVKQGVETGTWLDGDERARGNVELIARMRGVCRKYGRRSVEAKRVEEVLGVVVGKLATHDASKDDDGGDAVRRAEKVANGGGKQMELDLTPLSMNGTSASHSAITAAASSSSTGHSSAPAASLPTMSSIMTPPTNTSSISTSNTNSLPSGSPFASLLNLNDAHPIGPGITNTDMEVDIDWTSFDQFLNATLASANGHGLFNMGWGIDMDMDMDADGVES